MTRLAYILATDNYMTIRPVIERLRRQTFRQEIEVVVVAPTRALVEPVFAHQAEFAAVTFVEDPMTDLARARVAGIRATSAPTVFIGETHSYPHPEMVERLLAAREQGFTCAAPGMGNANPGSACSWAGFLSDYGRWLAWLPGGEIDSFPIYNAAFDRAALLALGDRLGPALSHGDEMQLRFTAAGHRTCFVPEARLDHVNVTPGDDWVYERLLAGLLIGHQRSRRWALARRWFYALCSPAIPLVLMWRVLPGVRMAMAHERLPLATLPLVVAGFLVKGVGEFAGYVGWPPEKAEADMHEYEVHKLSYAAKVAKS